MRGRNGLKFCMLMYPDHLPTWLDNGHNLLIFLIWAKFWHSEMGEIWGFWGSNLRFMGISQRKHVGNDLTFCMLMYPDHLQNWFFSRSTQNLVWLFRINIMAQNVISLTEQKCIGVHIFAVLQVRRSVYQLSALNVGCMHLYRQKCIGVQVQLFKWGRSALEVCSFAYVRCTGVRWECVH